VALDVLHLVRCVCTIVAGGRGLTTEMFMHRLIADLANHTTRAGVGLLLYSAALLVASLLLSTSWAPSGIVIGAVVVCVGHASAGLALVRRSAWRHALIVTSAGLHVALTITWAVVLISA
jgi:hypothetical protein